MLLPLLVTLLLNDGSLLPLLVLLVMLPQLHSGSSPANRAGDPLVADSVLSHPALMLPNLLSALCPPLPEGPTLFSTNPPFGDRTIAYKPCC